MANTNIKLYGGINMYKWQSELHNYITNYLKTKPDICKVITVKAARQIYGKSAAAKAELLRFSLNKAKVVNAYVSPTLKLAKKMYDEIIRDAEDLIVKKNAVDMYIEFANKSQIKFFSAEQREALRGHTVTGILIIDEAWFVPEDVYNELLSPWVVVHNALTLLISTPKYKTGYFYDAWVSGLIDNELYKTFDWSGDYPPDESTPFLMSKKATIPRQKYKSEYLGQWLEGEGAVFNYDSCLYDGTEDLDSLYIGLDWGTGSGQDYTVLNIFNGKGEQVAIHSWNDIDPTQQVDAITLIIQKYKARIKGIQAEQNSIGKIYLDMLKRKNPGVKIIPFNTTNDSKRKLVEKLQVAFDQNQIKILRDKEQMTQLSFYEATINKTNSVSYNAKSGYHDDIVMSLMLAFDLINSTKGTYAIR